MCANCVQTALKMDDVSLLWISSLVTHIFGGVMHTVHAGLRRSHIFQTNHSKPVTETQNIEWKNE